MEFGVSLFSRSDSHLHSCCFHNNIYFSVQVLENDITFLAFFSRKHGLDPVKHALFEDKPHFLPFSGRIGEMSCFLVEAAVRLGVFKSCSQTHNDAPVNKTTVKYKCKKSGDTTIWDKAMSFLSFPGFEGCISVYLIKLHVFIWLLQMRYSTVKPSVITCLAFLSKMLTKKGRQSVQMFSSKQTVEILS